MGQADRDKLIEELMKQKELLEKKQEEIAKKLRLLIYASR
jgi:hypothetical protein